MRSLVLAFVLLFAKSTGGCRRLHQDAPPTDLRSNLIRFGGPPPENGTIGASGPILTLGESFMNRIINNTRSGLESIEDLSNVLTTDADLWVDQRNEGLVQICSGLESTNATDADNSTAATSKEDLLAEAAAAGLTPQEVVLSRSSRPKATKKIVLDVDGHAVTGTVWNAITSKSRIDVPPFDTDGNPSSFSADELAAIDNIWRIVAEDYAPFDVDVTFADPGDAFLKQGNGMRACIGGNSELIGGQMGGIARIGEFGNGNPCFVFAENLQHSAKRCGDAASHEIGHTLGLYHDGAITGEAYYEGQGNWAPIMGKPYSANVAQFSKGDYKGANQRQDDLQVIQNHLDLIPPPDNLARSSAAPLRPNRPTQGTIARRKQTDFFEFAARPGPVTITAMGAGSIPSAFPGKLYNIGNLDVVLTLYNSEGRVLQRSSPSGASSDAMGGSITTSFTAATGTYFVSVGATGAGDPLDDGYSDYGSLGQYTLLASFTPTSGDPISGGTGGTGGTLFVARIKLHRVSDGFPLFGVRCKAAVSVKALGRGLTKSQAVPAARVTVRGRFSSSAGDGTFNQQVEGFTTRKGVVVFTSRPTVENECIFEVLGAASPGYEYTPAAKRSLVIQKMNW